VNGGACFAGKTDQFALEQNPERGGLHLARRHLMHDLLQLAVVDEVESPLGQRCVGSKSGRED